MRYGFKLPSIFFTPVFKFLLWSMIIGNPVHNLYDSNKKGGWYCGCNSSSNSQIICVPGNALKVEGNEIVTNGNAFENAGTWL